MSVKLWKSNYPFVKKKKWTSVQIFFLWILKVHPCSFRGGKKVSRYRPFFAGYFFKSYGFSTVAKNTRFAKMALTPQIFAQSSSGLCQSDRANSEMIFNQKHDFRKFHDFGGFLAPKWSIYGVSKPDMNSSEQKKHRFSKFRAKKNPDFQNLV